MNIFQYCRQFGRRYFWPHLLLGVLATCFGISINIEKNAQSQLVSSPSSILSHLDNTTLSANNLDFWQLIQYRHNSGQVNQWQQLAIRRFLTRLALSVSPKVSSELYGERHAQIESEPHYNYWAVINRLISLVTPVPIPVQTSESISYHHFVPSYDTGIWLAKMGGIRAGPSVKQ